MSTNDDNLINFINLTSIKFFGPVFIESMLLNERQKMEKYDEDIANEEEVEKKLEIEKNRNHELLYLDVCQRSSKLWTDIADGGKTDDTLIFGLNLLRDAINLLPDNAHKKEICDFVSSYLDISQKSESLKEFEQYERCKMIELD